MDTTPVFLVVDDEPLISKTIRMLLERNLKCKVLEYHDPAEAFAAFQEHKNSITLVITDFFMPGFSGVDLCQKIRQLNPDVLLLMISAYGAIDQVQNGAALAGIDAFMAKPFRMEALLALVLQLLKDAKDPGERSHLFVQQFIEHAQFLAQGQLEQKPSPMPFVLKLLEKHNYDPQRLARMKALQTTMAEEENYLGALEVVADLRTHQTKRVTDIKRWLDANKDLIKSA